MTKSMNNILPNEGEVYYFEKVFNEADSKMLFETLLKNISWEQQQIKIFGKTVNMPRLTAWYGDPGKKYTYSGIENNPLPWTKELLLIKTQIEKISGEKFNSVLLNLYRDGSDSMGWHKDDEKELGIRPVIASVSFGATRRFKMRHGKKKDLKLAIELETGSLLLMKGETQDYWYHCVPRTKKQLEPRINLTFRRVI